MLFDLQFYLLLCGTYGLLKILWFSPRIIFILTIILLLFNFYAYPSQDSTSSAFLDSYSYQIHEIHHRCFILLSWLPDRHHIEDLLHDSTNSTVIGFVKAILASSTPSLCGIPSWHRDFSSCCYLLLDRHTLFDLRATTPMLLTRSNTMLAALEPFSLLLQLLSIFPLTYFPSSSLTHFVKNNLKSNSLLTRMHMDPPRRPP